MSQTNGILVIIMLFPILAFAQDGLIAHWTLDEGEGTFVTDSVGGYLGELINTVEWAVPEEAKIGSGALYFNAQEDYVQTDLLDDLVYADEFTLCAWFNTEIVDEGQQHILWIGAATENGFGVGQECHLTVNHFTYLEKVVFNFGDGWDTNGDIVNIISAEDFYGVDEWHHLAGVIRIIERETDTLTVGELYLDGEWVEPMEHEYPSRDTVYHEVARDMWDTPLRFGAPGVTSSRNFLGLIDDVQIYNRALTKEEIAVVMTGAHATSTVDRTDRSMPTTCYLSDNYPNPFNPETNIYFSLTQSDLVSLTIYDILGKEVQNLVSELKDAGTHRSTFNAAGLSSGVYFYQLKVGGRIVDTKKMLLVQ